MIPIHLLQQKTIMWCTCSMSKEGTLYMMAILSLICQNYTSLLKLINKIRCYIWNTAGNSCFLYFWLPIFSPISWTNICHKVPRFNVLHYMLNHLHTLSAKKWQPCGWSWIQNVYYKPMNHIIESLKIDCSWVLGSYLVEYQSLMSDCSWVAILLDIRTDNVAFKICSVELSPRIIEHTGRH